MRQILVGWWKEGSVLSLTVWIGRWRLWMFADERAVFSIK